MCPLLCNEVNLNQSCFIPAASLTKLKEDVHHNLLNCMSTLSVVVVVMTAETPLSVWIYFCSFLPYTSIKLATICATRLYGIIINYVSTVTKFRLHLG